MAARKALEAAYATPELNTRSIGLLAERAGVARKDAAAFLKTSAPAQLARLARRPHESQFAPTGGPAGTYLADVIYFTDLAGVNRKRKAIITLIEANTRYAYARGLTAATAAKAAEALQSIVDENAEDGHTRIRHLRVDGGPEFMGAFSKLAGELGLSIEVTQAGTHERLARIDRFHGSLRRMIGDVMDSNGDNVWYDHLAGIIANYNARPQRSLSAALGQRTAPTNVGASALEAVRAHDMRRAQAVRSSTSTLAPGSHVRLLMKRTVAGSKNAFAKSHQPRWTSATHEVLERVGPNSFRIDVPRGEVAVWPLHALQPVDAATGSLPRQQRVNVKVAAGLRRLAAELGDSVPAALPPDGPRVTRARARREPR